MNKYDMMIACNRKQVKKDKQRLSTNAQDREKVTVPKLVKRTGLSRDFTRKPSEKKWTGY